MSEAEPHINATGPNCEHLQARVTKKLYVTKQRVSFNGNASCASPRVPDHTFDLRRELLPSHDYKMLCRNSAQATSDSAAPSSPRGSTAFCSDNAECVATTPPSSPPGFPWEKENNEPSTTASCPPVASKNAFSILGKRKHQPLSQPDERPTKRPASAAKKTSGRLEQMQLSLGQKTLTRCQACGMEYVPSSAEDRKMHEKYHKQNTEGYDVGEIFVDRTCPGRRFWGRGGDMIIVIDVGEYKYRQKKAQAALDIVQRELGAVPIPEDEIWKLDDVVQPRFRSYMYIRDTKCIGFLLTECISEAHEVLKPDIREGLKETKAGKALTALRARKEMIAQEMQFSLSQPIKVSESKVPAVLGISRIWTSPLHRKQNIATALLDRAMIYHYNLENAVNKTQLVLLKDQVAFSQPTDSGSRLARKWTGKAYGWKVY